MLVKEGKKNQKEFEEAHANDVPTQETDPLDMPQNLNPMLKSENTYTFVQSEQAQDTDDKADEQKTENEDYNGENAAQNASKTTENEANDAVSSNDASVADSNQSVEESKNE